MKYEKRSLRLHRAYQGIATCNQLKRVSDMSALAEVIDQDVQTLMDSVGGNSAQLPVGELRLLNHVPLMSDSGGRYGKGQVVTQMVIDPESWFFKCHFPDDPIMPGCLGIEGLWQSLGLYLALKGFKGKGRALGVSSLKFSGEVLPSAKCLQFQLHIRKVVERDWVIALADGEVFVDGKLIYEAKDLKVGIFPEVKNSEQNIGESK